MADLLANLYQKNLRQYARGKLLDLGCGKVPLFSVYKEYITENICVDCENTLHSNEYVDFECDLTKDLPFDDNEFDTLILSDVLEHIPKPEKLWKEMYRILSKNGMLILNVPFYYWIHERPHDYYRYTEFALKRFVDESGLSLVKLESIGGSPEVLADLLAKHVQFLPLIGVPLAIFVQNGASAFVTTSFGKKISAETS